MAEEWFYAHEGQEFGPFSSAELKRLGANGNIRPTDLVWKAGMTKRVPARAVKGLCPQPAGAARGPSAALSRPRTPAPSPALEELIELTAVDSPSTPTQAVPTTQVEDVVELTAVEPSAPPYPAQAQYAQPAPPPRAVAIPEDLQPYEEDEPRRRDPKSRGRKPQRGSLLWLWLLLGIGGLVLVGGGVLLIVLLGGKGKVTRENFAKLQNGMTENEVRQILGSPTDTRNLGQANVLLWRSGDNVITVTLINDRVFALQGIFDGVPAGFGGPGPGRPNFGGGGPRFP